MDIEMLAHGFCRRFTLPLGAASLAAVLLLCSSPAAQAEHGRLYGSRSDSGRVSGGSSSNRAPEASRPSYDSRPTYRAPEPTYRAPQPTYRAPEVYRPSERPNYAPPARTPEPTRGGSIFSGGSHLFGRQPEPERPATTYRTPPSPYLGGSTTSRPVIVDISQLGKQAPAPAAPQPQYQSWGEGTYHPQGTYYEHTNFVTQTQHLTLPGSNLQVFDNPSPGLFHDYHYRRDHDEGYRGWDYHPWYYHPRDNFTLIIDPWYYPYYAYDPYYYPYPYRPYPVVLGCPDVYVPPVTYQSPEVVYVPQQPQVVYVPETATQPGGAAAPDATTTSPGPAPLDNSPSGVLDNAGGSSGSSAAAVPAGAQKAIADIQEAWIVADPSLLQRHVDRDHPVRFYQDGVFDRVLSMDEYLAAAHRNFDALLTQSFALNHQSVLPDGTVQACGRHVFYDQDNHRQVSYACYSLAPVGDHWVIVAVNNASDPDKMMMASAAPGQDQAGNQ